MDWHWLICCICWASHLTCKWIDSENNIRWLIINKQQIIILCFKKKMSQARLNIPQETSWMISVELYFRRRDFFSDWREGVLWEWALSCECAVGQADRATVWMEHTCSTYLVNLTTQTYTDTDRGVLFRCLCVCVCVLPLNVSALHWHTLSSRLASMCLRSCCLQSAGILDVMSSGFCGTTGLTLMVSSDGFSGQVARV